MQAQSRREVHIDAFADGVQRYPRHAVVFIDILLSSTTLVTSATQGRRTLVAASLDEGRRRARGLRNPILAADPGADAGFEFDSRTGPSRLSTLASPERPFLLLSPAVGFFSEAGQAPALFVACLRNMTATIEALSQEHDEVVLVATGHAGQARCEDQMVAGWMGARLLELGYAPSGLQTIRAIERWGRADLSVLALGRGADHLRRLGRDEDLDFVLQRVDDLDTVCRYHADEVRATWPAPVHRVAAMAH